MNREREKQVQAVTVGVCAGVLTAAAVGTAAAQWGWVGVIVRTLAMTAVCTVMVLATAYAVWCDGRRWERENGGRRCGARGEDEDEEGEEESAERGEVRHADRG